MPIVNKDYLLRAALPTDVMALAVHPFIISQPFRQKYLEKVLGYITAHDDVWLATSDDIADWYFRHHYDEAIAAISHGKQKVRKPGSRENSERCETAVWRLC